MRKIENFAQISDLLNAQLKRGVITNNFLRGDDYTREIANRQAAAAMPSTLCSAVSISPSSMR